MNYGHDDWYYNSDGTRSRMTDDDRINDKIDGAHLGSKAFKDLYRGEKDTTRDDDEDDD